MPTFRFFAAFAIAALLVMILFLLKPIHIDVAAGETFARDAEAEDDRILRCIRVIAVTLMFLFVVVKCTWKEVRNRSSIPATTMVPNIRVPSNFYSSVNSRIRSRTDRIGNIAPKKSHARFSSSGTIAPTQLRLHAPSNFPSQ